MKKVHGLVVKVNNRSRKGDSAGENGFETQEQKIRVYPLVKAKENMNQGGASYPTKRVYEGLFWGEAKSFGGVDSCRDRMCSKGKQYKGQVMRQLKSGRT